MQRLTYGNPTGMLNAGTLGQIGLIQAPPGDGSSAHLSGYTDQRGNETLYLQDDFGQLVAVISPDTGLQTYRHDAAGNITQETAAEGETTTYAYDAANRVTRWEDNDGVTTITYHPGNGKPATIQSATGSERFDYNADGHLTVHSRQIDGHALTTRYAYTPQGQLREKTLPDGQSLHYHYYADGIQKDQLRAITREDFFGQTTVIGEIHKDTNGSQHAVHGNGITTDIRYSDAGQLLGIDHGQTGQLVYHYDVQGRITGIDHNGLSTQYDYDALGRLTQTLTPDGQTTYGYDTVGNRIEATQDGQTTTYVYSEAGEGNRLQQAGDTRYEYNAAGSPIHKGTLRYEYNVDQRPIKVYRTDGEPNDSKTLIAEYAYNSFGERIKKVAYSGNGRQVTYYFYDPEGRLTAEADEQGKITAQYVYLNDYRPVAKLQKKAIYALHSGRLGTPVKATDEAGNTVWAAAYDPFGQARLKTEQITLNLRLPGQYYDAETNTHYNYQRDYDPETGRYLTADPVGLEGGTNLYAYVTNNPLALMDPRGESIFSWIAKKGAKKGITAALRKQLQDAIKKKITKIGNSRVRKNLDNELTNILTELALFDGIGVWDVIEIIVPGSELVTICLDAKKIRAIKKLINKFDGKLDKLLKGGFPSFTSLKRALGSPGKNNQWHHVVEQSKVGKFGSKAINNVDNVVAIPKGVHQKISNYYSSKQSFTGGKTVRKWLKGQTFQQQKQFGQQIVKDALAGRI